MPMMFRSGNLRIFLIVSKNKGIYQVSEMAAIFNVSPAAFQKAYLYKYIYEYM
jgi:hypothetical protein